MSDVFADPGAQPSRLLVKWRWEPKQNKEKSKAEGRPVFEDAPWITIRIPGDPTFAIDHFASPEEMDQHAASFEAFRRKESSEGIVGTRLEEWPQISRSMVEELKHFSIRTVEQLAALTDSNTRNVPRGMDLRERAKAFLAAAKASAPVAELQEKNRDLEARLAAMEKQLEQAMQELDKATAPKRKAG